MALWLNAAYAAALAAASPFIAYKVATRPRWRAGLLQRLGKVPPRNPNRRCIWIHAASVGEVLAVRSLIPALEAALPEYEVVLSTTTVEGSRTVTEKLGRRSFFFPIDLTPVVRATLATIRPDLILLVERDIWPNFVSMAHAAGIPIAVINGIVSNSFIGRFQALARLRLTPLTQINHFAVQTELYKQRLLGLGLEASKISVTGNVKYDNLPAEPDPAAQHAMRERLGVSEADWLWVAGSTRETEEKTVIAAYTALRKSMPQARLVLVPRHIDRRAEVAQAVQAGGFVPVFKTELDGGGKPVPENSVIVVDTFGELETLYSIASVVFVGGTLTPESGGHNFLEPAAFAKPILVGPHVRNFQAAADSLLEADALVMVQCLDSMSGAIRSLAEHPDRAAAIGLRAAEIVNAYRGATDRTVEAVRQLVHAST